MPERGDIIWIDCDPQVGREQAGGRPAIVLSPAKYNDKSSLAVMLLITSQEKGYPFEAKLPPGITTRGVILCDQVKSFDWRVRRAKFKEKAPADTVIQAIALLNTLLK